MMNDYISREAAADVLRRLANALDEQIGYPSQMADVCQGVILDAATEISLLPAADMEPVRRGNWNIRLADEMTLCLECSICGRKVDNIDLHHLLESGEYGEACQRYPYCHCGATMDLEGDHEGL